MGSRNDLEEQDGQSEQKQPLSAVGMEYSRKGKQLDAEEGKRRGVEKGRRQLSYVKEYWCCSEKEECHRTEE